jgi:hypothetical protein
VFELITARRDKKRLDVWASVGQRKRVKRKRKEK